MRSNASTVAEYLKSMPEERRAEISKVRDVVLKNLTDGYVEVMNWGMICYEIPLKDYPNTYNKQPLGCAALAMQKHYCALYLGVYQDSKQLAQLKKAFADAGKKLDMGKCCIRFKKADDLPLPAIGKIIAASTVKKMIKGYETARAAGHGKC